LNSIKCKYTEKPYWDDLHNQQMYYCDETPLPSGYCIFHDENFLDNENVHYSLNVQRIKDEFRSKFERYINEKKELRFIGYILPDLELPNVTISNNLYFMEV